MKFTLLCLVVLFGIVTANIGGPSDDHGCIGGAGYQWCQRERACVRSWELAAANNLENTPEAFAAYCNATPFGGDHDSHGCIGSAGYQWCQREESCVRSWELASIRNFENSKEAFESYCNATPIGSDRDDHGCIGSAGYQWCQREESCVRSWEVISRHNLENSQEAFESYCNPTPIGGDRDEHGCVGSAGYQWCEQEGSCVRSWELASIRNFENSEEAFESYCNPTPIGGDRDDHGCIHSAGYQWCERESSCVRSWEVAASNNFDNTQAAFELYCSMPVVGNLRDEHGCLISGGYQWCAQENQCVRMWELAAKLNLPPLHAERYCNNQL